MAALIDRLIGNLTMEEDLNGAKIAIHAFTATMAEIKLGVSGMTSARMQTEFGLTNGEQAKVDVVIATRDPVEIFNILSRGEARNRFAAPGVKYYSRAEVLSRLGI